MTHQSLPSKAVETIPGLKRENEAKFQQLQALESRVKSLKNATEALKKESVIVQRDTDQVLAARKEITARMKQFEKESTNLIQSHRTQRPISMRRIEADGTGAHVQILTKSRLELEMKRRVVMEAEARACKEEQRAIELHNSLAGAEKSYTDYRRTLESRTLGLKGAADYQMNRLDKLRQEYELAKAQAQAQDQILAAQESLAAAQVAAQQTLQLHAEREVSRLDRLPSSPGTVQEALAAGYTQAEINNWYTTLKESLPAESPSAETSEASIDGATRRDGKEKDSETCFFNKADDRSLTKWVRVDHGKDLKWDSTHQLEDLARAWKPSTKILTKLDLSPGDLPQYADHHLHGTLTALSNCEALTHLRLDNCRGITGGLEPLESMTRLTHLSLKDCQGLDGPIEPIRKLTELAYLGIHSRDAENPMSGLQGHIFPVLLNLPNLRELDIRFHGVPNIFGGEFAQQLRDLIFCVHREKSHAPEWKAAMLLEVKRLCNTFLAAYSGWRLLQVAKDTQFSGLQRIPPEDRMLRNDATAKECGWFESLFRILMESGEMDKECLLLDAMDHSLYAAAKVLVDAFEAKGTGPVEADDQMRIVSDMKGFSSLKMQALVSSLGTFLGRFKIRPDGCLRRSGRSMDFQAVDCKATEKDPSATVMRFVKYQDQFEREVTVRARGLDPEYVVEVITTSQELGEQKFASAAKKLGYFSYGFLLQGGERTLQDMVLVEKLDGHQIRKLMDQVFDGVAYLHSEGLVHNDIRPVNVWCRERDKSMRLADLTATTGSSDDGELPSYAGSIFSSGVLPPEMFYKLRNDAELEMYLNYFRSVETTDPALFRKIAPKYLASGQYMVVKTFLVDPKNPAHPWTALPLPYDLVKTSTAIDIWALGCLLYQLHVGMTLSPVTWDDDHMDGEGMEQIMEWDSEQLHRKLEAVRDIPAREIISSMLSPDPDVRKALDLNSGDFDDTYFQTTWSEDMSSPSQKGGLLPMGARGDPGETVPTKLSASFMNDQAQLGLEQMHEAEEEQEKEQQQQQQQKQASTPKKLFTFSPSALISLSFFKNRSVSFGSPTEGDSIRDNASSRSLDADFAEAEERTALNSVLVNEVQSLRVQQAEIQSVLKDLRSLRTPAAEPPAEPTSPVSSELPPSPQHTPRKIEERHYNTELQVGESKKFKIGFEGNPETRLHVWVAPECLVDVRTPVLEPTGPGQTRAIRVTLEPHDQAEVRDYTVWVSDQLPGLLGKGAPRPSSYSEKLVFKVNYTEPPSIADDEELSTSEGISQQDVERIVQEHQQEITRHLTLELQVLKAMIASQSSVPSTDVEDTRTPTPPRTPAAPPQPASVEASTEDPDTTDVPQDPPPATAGLNEDTDAHSEEKAVEKHDHLHPLHKGVKQRHKLDSHHVRSNHTVFADKPATEVDADSTTISNGDLDQSKATVLVPSPAENIKSAQNNAKPDVSATVESLDIISVQRNLQPASRNDAPVAAFSVRPAENPKNPRRRRQSRTRA